MLVVLLSQKLPWILGLSMYRHHSFLPYTDTIPFFQLSLMKEESASQHIWIIYTHYSQYLVRNARQVNIINLTSTTWKNLFQSVWHILKSHLLLHTLQFRGPGKQKYLVKIFRITIVSISWNLHCVCCRGMKFAEYLQMNNQTIFSA